MVRELLPKLSDHPSLRDPADDDAPSIFRRPSDVPDPLPAIRHGDQVAQLHREWVRVTAQPAPAGQGQASWQRLVRAGRRVLNRGPGSVNQEMIADLIRAVDAVAARCDELGERLNHQHVVLDDAITIFGKELTRLRAQSTPSGPGEVPTSPSQ